MPTAWDVYAHELLHVGYGYPLWDPSPDSQSGEIEIGDVGFIENGQFVRLFNPTFPQEHPANRAWGLPKGCPPLEIADRLVHDKELTFSSDSLCSRHVTRAEVNAKVDVDSAVDLALKYNTASASGAVLYLPTRSARQRSVLRESLVMREYLQKHYPAWHHHLHRHNALKLARRDLLFVRGWTKTARWAVAAFADSSREEGATLGAGHGPAKASFSIDLARQEALGGWTSVCPKRDTDAEDQCIFVQFLQYTTRDAFQRWVLKRKRSFDKILHISPKKQADGACADEGDSDRHVDKKRRIHGPEVRAPAPNRPAIEHAQHDTDAEEGSAVFSLTHHLADRIFQGADVDIAVTDSDDLASLLEQKAAALGRVADAMLAGSSQGAGDDGKVDDVFSLDAKSGAVEVKAVIKTVEVKVEKVPDVETTEPAGSSQTEPDPAHAPKAREATPPAEAAPSHPAKRKRAPSTPPPAKPGAALKHANPGRAQTLSQADGASAAHKRRDI